MTYIEFPLFSSAKRNFLADRYNPTLSFRYLYHPYTVPANADKAFLQTLFGSSIRTRSLFENESLFLYLFVINISIVNSLYEYWKFHWVKRSSIAKDKNGDLPFSVMQDEICRTTVCGRLGDGRGACRSNEATRWNRGAQTNNRTNNAKYSKIFHV